MKFHATVYVPFLKEQITFDVEASSTNEAHDKIGSMSVTDVLKHSKIKVRDIFSWNTSMSAEDQRNGK